MKRFFFTSVILSLLTSILLSFNAHAQNEFVDLGLSVKWATCNVGASSPKWPGEYYTFDNALTLKKNGERLPTKEEVQELIDNCTWSLIGIDYYFTGWEVASKKNGKSIFLPYAGFYDFNSGSLECGGSGGSYWTSSISEDNMPYVLILIGGAPILIDGEYHGIGNSVRLVQDVKK